MAAATAAASSSGSRKGGTGSGLHQSSAGTATGPLSGSDTLLQSSSGTEEPAIPSRPPRKRKPGAKWDGRLASLTLQEYREMKWSPDAGANSLMRRGPSYTMRALPRPRRSKSDVLLEPNPVEVMNKLRTTAPSWSMSRANLHPAPSAAASPGPIYALPSTMEPFPHVTVHKHTGTRFGSATIAATDPDGTAPGPGQYNPDAWKYSSLQRTMPNFKVQGREGWKESSLKMPGPEVGEYDPKKVYRTGTQFSPVWTIPHSGDPLPTAPILGSRRLVTPGPPHYRPPGADARNEHVAKARPSSWSFSHDNRGLI